MAIVIAISASVTVSIGELTMGTESLILLVSFELMSTCSRVRIAVHGRLQWPAGLLWQAAQ